MFGRHSKAPFNVHTELEFLQGDGKQLSLAAATHSDTDVFSAGAGSNCASLSQRRTAVGSGLLASIVEQQREPFNKFPHRLCTLDSGVPLAYAVEQEFGLYGFDSSVLFKRVPVPIALPDCI